jgi:HlyD family secretion protein
MRRKALTIAVSVAAIVVVAIVLMAVLRKGDNQERTLRTARVERGSIVVKVTESGEVAPLTVVNVKSELAGEVKRLYVEEGDSVKAGDNLALIQQEASQTQQIAQARASVENTKLDLDDAKRELDRQQELYDKDFIAKKDVEDAQKAYRRSQIQYELAQKQLWVVLGGGTQSAEPGSLGTKAFDNITVTAPISGVVLSLDVEQGEMITSGTQAFGGGGTILMTIADLSKMIVTTNVNEVDVGKIKVGQAAEIGFDAIRGRVYRGVVKKISPAGTLDGNVVVFPVEVEIVGSISGEFQSAPSGASSRSPGGSPLAGLPQEQRDALRKRIEDLRAQGAGQDEIRGVIDKALAEQGGASASERRPGPGTGLHPTGEADRAGIALIKPGMTADLDIIIARAENVLILPKEAVTVEDGKASVTLLEGEKTASHPVSTGIEDNIDVEISDGLEEGEEVVIPESGSAIGRQGQAQQGPPHEGPPL